MTDFVGTIKKLAETVGGILGGPLVPMALEIGKDVLNLVDKSMSVVNATDVVQLKAIRDDLEPKVLAHEERTEASLRGG